MVKNGCKYEKKKMWPLRGKGDNDDRWESWPLRNQYLSVYPLQEMNRRAANYATVWL
jgi:hypothetical protein